MSPSETCTEFGWYQTTDSPATSQPFGNLVPLSYSLQLCNDVYDLGTNFDFQAAMNATNTLFGAKSPRVERVIYVDGTIDPWRPMTVTQQFSPESPVFTVTGTAHCATSLPYDASIDPAELETVYNAISKQLGQWISQETQLPQ